MRTETVKIGNLSFKRLIPSNGKILTNGEQFAPTEVCLSPLDSPENWREVTPAEAERMQAELEAKQNENEPES